MGNTREHAPRTESAAFREVRQSLIFARSSDPVSLRTRVDGGDLGRISRGAYLQSVEGETRWREHEREALARILAVAERVGTAYWFSHESAAFLHGCSLYRMSLTPHVTQQTRRAGNSDRDVTRHHGMLLEDERTELASLPVTTIERTIVDCAASLPPDQALVIADSALRRGASLSTMLAATRRRSGNRGIARARRILGLADARAETPGESLLRWVMHDHGLPVPELQIAVRTAAGLFSIDLGLLDLRVAIEFDGLVKYSGGYGDAPEVLFAEKRRQEALEEEGWIFVRVTWEDLRDPVALVERIRRAMRRAARRA